MAGSKPKFILITLQNVETNTKPSDKCTKRFANSRCFSDLLRSIVARTIDKQAADTWFVRIKVTIEDELTEIETESVRKRIWSTNPTWVEWVFFASWIRATLWMINANRCFWNVKWHNWKNKLKTKTIPIRFYWNFPSIAYFLQWFWRMLDTKCRYDDIQYGYQKD